MKRKVYIFVISALILQSCSHTVIYQESSSNSSDSRYMAKNMEFAYKANGKRLSPSLVRIGERIYNHAKADSSFQSYLQSAVDFETRQNEVIGFKHAGLETAIANSEKTLVSLQLSNAHKTVVASAQEQKEELSRYNDVDFKDYWQRVYQLSHRGLLQHYMTSDAEYAKLSSSNKAFLYGYILRKDISQCQNLAENTAQEEKRTLSKLQYEMQTIKDKHEKILKEQAERERRQRELERKQREAEERARREAAEREAAQRRWYDNSWMNGHWNIHISGIGTMNYYIDTDRMWIKVYTTSYSELRPHLLYSGPFTISNGEGKYRRYKVITYRDPKISGVAFTQFADPNKGLLYDEIGGYFRKMR